MVFQEVENLLLSIAYEGKYIDAQGSRRVEHITVENESLLLYKKAYIVHIFRDPPKYFYATI